MSNLDVMNKIFVKEQQKLAVEISLMRKKLGQQPNEEEGPSMQEEYLKELEARVKEEFRRK